MSASIHINAKTQNKKIIFNDDGEILPENKVKKASNKLSKTKVSTGIANTPINSKKVFSENIEKDSAIEDENDEGEDYFEMLDKKRQAASDVPNDDDIEKKWYEIYAQYNGIDNSDSNIKDHERIELSKLCKTSYDAELSGFVKRNPTDGKWLETALHKGTSKDRANAGALLVTSNPLGNLTTLETLISFSKVTNKSSPEAVNVLTDLFMEILLPTNRKLIGINQRGADWKALVKQSDVLHEAGLKKIYAYWHFENELKNNYFEFLKNLQLSLQTGQENNKSSSIISAAKLLAKAPEKEQMLLTMLINKLGDPVSKIASKALHHLSEVVYEHPNMCGVIIIEAEKLLFRNNISERAQHFALCFLAQIAPNGRPEVCTKLVNICFSLFKVLVQKGAVNNRTMQAILRCLQKAILEAKPIDGNTEIMTKDMQDTIYRLVHLADIRISLQTLSLLLQMVSAKSEQSDRFYNVLYKKLLDLNLTTVGTKTSAQFLHIIHRAIHIDNNVPRAQAFIKRLLQLSLYMPSQITAGILIVINKLFNTRSALFKDYDDELKENAMPVVAEIDDNLSRFDSDGEEKYEDVDANDEPKDLIKSTTASVSSSWHHVTLAEQQKEEQLDVKAKDIGITKYDPYHRIPAYAGADLASKNELLLLQDHFHPTVKVFAENILQRKKINYYGDPLKDFSLTYFLERFSFKNPKKLDDRKSDMIKSVSSKHYVPYGVRGKSVKSLTKANCTEDERFIFNYLEKKRETQIVVKKKNDDDDDDDFGQDVNDDEFEAYMDRLSGKNKDDDNFDGMEIDEEEEDNNLDFLTEIGGEIKQKKKTKKAKKSMDDDEDGDDIDNDWGDDNASDNDIGSDADEDGSIDYDHESDDESISLPDDDDDDDDNNDDDFEEDDDDIEEDNFSSDGNNDDDEDEDDSQPKSKKSRISGKQFSSTLKHKTDMSSLFAAADDFAELLEESGKAKGQGTSNAISNKDNLSEKHLKWEEKRRSNYGKQRNFNNQKRKMGKSRRN